MIFDLCTSLQEALEDEVQQLLELEKIPSLKEERAVQEAMMNEEAKKKQELEKQKSQVDKVKEEKALRQMVDEELYRRKQSNRRSKNLPISKLVSNSKGKHSVLELGHPSTRKAGFNWICRLIIYQICGMTSSLLIG